MEKKRERGNLNELDANEITNERTNPPNWLFRLMASKIFKIQILRY